MNAPRSGYGIDAMVATTPDKKGGGIGGIPARCSSRRYLHKANNLPSLANVYRVLEHRDAHRVSLLLEKPLGLRFPRRRADGQPCDRS